MAKAFTRRSTLALAGAATAAMFAPGVLRAQTQAPYKVRIGYPPQVDCVPYWIAQDKSYLAEEGVVAEWTPTPLTAMTPGILTKSLDLAIMNTIQAMQPIDAGLAVALVSGAYTLPSVGNLGVARRVGATIAKPEDLVGKRLGVASYASIMLYMFNYWYDQQGLSYKKLKWIEADGPTQREMFRRGELDAALAYDPWFSVMKEDGTGEDFIDFYKETPVGTMVTGCIGGREWAAANPKALAAFRRAIVKGAEAAKDIDLSKATVKKWAKLSDDVVKRLAIPTFAAEIKPLNLDHVIKVMKHQGLLTTDLTFEKVTLPWSV
jgi:NitT/TauT family transport system substrate-binding protein